jgi:hypothetical protein
MMAKNRSTMSAAVFALALMAALCLTVMSAPVSALSSTKATSDNLDAELSEPASRLQLISIRCLDQEDSLGSDTPYIVFDGIRLWKDDMEEGQSRSLTHVPQVRFFGNKILSLWEEDNDPDDHLGSVSVSYTGGTEQTRPFTEDPDAEYEITYVVYQDNTPPEIIPIKPAPGSKIRDRTPLIQATVRDAETELTQSNMKLFVDGRPKAFSYNAATDRLSHLSNRLSYSKHTVRVEATDGELNATRIWSFRVVR